MAGVPLQYPSEWHKVVSRNFLLGLPLVGAQVSVYRDLCDQLASRTADCWAQWGEYEPRLELAQSLACALGDAADWPNAIFLPADPFVLAAWDHDSCAIDDLAVVAALDDVARRVGLPKGSVHWGRFESSSVGEVVDQLLRQGTTYVA
jgi:hypothetical protein